MSLLTSLISKVNDVFRKYTQKLKQINTTQEFENFTRQYSEELDGKTGLEMATFFAKFTLLMLYITESVAKKIFGSSLLVEI